MRKPLECGSHWNAVAIGIRLRVLGPPTHWNADVNKEGWLSHLTLECGCSCAARSGPATVRSECGSQWNADVEKRGVAQPLNLGMRMQLYRVAQPLEIGMRMQLHGRLPFDIGMRKQLWEPTQLLECG
ncbi:hypothetical protein QAD02_003242 [Eretmocerus hayati]|uniref:Uncharacterized protein n=2 Tax=Eretmocerus hayati TaxID=131215 RepID=A0ACC2NM82_9HYME|nr:hypothetical protein QAD02_003238 [Eretmocerus hayati]KAJ8671983.1 hypothetical protein QAD02_003242 [Eretmocerus hayati]